MIVIRYTLLLLLILSPLSAADYSVISELGSSAKAIALGNIDGFGDSRAAVFNNPAALSNTEKVSVSLFTTSLMNDLNYISGSINIDLPVGKLGLGYYQASTNDIYSSLENNDNRFESTGTFSYKNSIAKLSYQAQPLASTSIAGSYSLYSQESLGISGIGSNIDIGIIQEFRRISMSIFAQNIISNASMTYKSSDSDSELFPFILSAAFHIPVAGFNIFPQIKKHEDILLYSCGLSYSPKFFNNLELMMGYKQDIDALQNVHNKASFGLGLHLMGLEMNYSFVKSDYFLTDNSNFFSMSYGF